MVLVEMGQIKLTQAQVFFFKGVDALTKRANTLTSYQLHAVLEAMMVVDKYGQPFGPKPGVKTQIGLITLSFINKCLQSQIAGVCEFATNVLVDFYGLRFGAQNIE